MIADTQYKLPTCEVVREDPARPALRRRLKHYGMRVAGRFASLLALCGRSIATDTFGILVYHRVAPVAPGFPTPAFNVTPMRFREQLSGLQRRGFYFLPLQEVLAKRARNESLPTHSVVLTFDDGYESVYEQAWPVLRELGVPATVFINTAYLDVDAPFPHDAWGQVYAGQVPSSAYRAMSTAQCAELAATNLIELGAHTHTHADFRGRPGVFRRDMQECLRRMRHDLGIERPTFAFPYGCQHSGFTDEALVNVVRELGLLCALTTDAACVRPDDSPYHWGRFNVYDWDTDATIAAKLQGYYSWAPRLGQRLAQLVQRRPAPARGAVLADGGRHNV